MSTELIHLTEEEFRDYGVRKNIIRVELQEAGDKLKRVGEELEYIRENMLYRDEYETFEDFVRLEFDKTRQWAYEQIQYVKVVTNLESKFVSSNLQNPTVSQAAALATIDEEEQADAYAEAVEKAESEGKQKPTTKDVKETVQKRKNAKGGEYKPPKTEKSESPSIVLDALDRPVPESLRDQHGLSGPIQSLGRAFDKIKKDAAELAEHPGGVHIDLQTLSIELKAAKRTLTESRYYCECPRCGATGIDCRNCNDSGFIPYSKKGQFSGNDKKFLGIDE